jgi:hypothetical protein
MYAGDAPARRSDVGTHEEVVKTTAEARTRVSAQTSDAMNKQRR